MKLLSLYWSLLRYRVAVMIILFMLLGAAWHGGLTAIDPPVLLMVLALASSYVSGTSVNDISDRKIDEINHPGDRGRPLVTGAARTADLWILFGVSSVLAVAVALAAGPAAADAGRSLRRHPLLGRRSGGRRTSWDVRSPPHAGPLSALRGPYHPQRLQGQGGRRRLRQADFPPEVRQAGNLPAQPLRRMRRGRPARRIPIRQVVARGPPTTLHRKYSDHAPPALPNEQPQG